MELTPTLTALDNHGRGHYQEIYVMSDKQLTSAHMPLVERLRKAATCVYIAVEKDVADDLSDMLRKAADEIDRLRQFEPSPHPDGRDVVV